MEHKNFERMTVSALKNLARERGIHRYSKLNRAELIDQLKNPSPLEYTRDQLRQMARERGLQGYYNLPKNELPQRLMRTWRPHIGSTH